MLDEPTPARPATEGTARRTFRATGTGETQMNETLRPRKQGGTGGGRTDRQADGCLPSSAGGRGRQRSPGERAGEGAQKGKDSSVRRVSPASTGRSQGGARQRSHAGARQKDNARPS